MKHNVDRRKLGMKTKHRLSTLSNMASSLVRHDRIETTLPRAKELRRIADRLVTLGKSGSLAARRKVMVIVRDKEVATKVFSELAPRFLDRKGGYTRIFRLGNRHGDNAPMALIEYLPSKDAPKKEDVKKDAKADKKAKAEKKDVKKVSKKAETKETKKSAKSPAKKKATKKKEKKETKKKAVTKKKK